MIISRIAYRYAKSLYELSKEQNALDTVKEDMTLVLTAITDSRELANLLKSPIVSLDKKSVILSKIFEGKVSKNASSLISLLVKKGRESELAGVAQSFLNIFNEENNIVKAKLTTAIALEDNLKADFLKVAENISGKKVELTEVVDEEVIGGYVLRFEDTQLDASVKTKLNKVKQKLFQ